MRRRFFTPKKFRPRGRWVEFTYEFGYRLEGGAHREYFTYEVNLVKWVPEGEKPGNLWLGWKEEAKNVMFKDVGADKIAHHWFSMPEGPDRGGWQTVLAAVEPWTRGPFRQRWVKK